MKNSIKLEANSIIEHCIEVSGNDKQVRRIAEDYIYSFIASNYVNRQHIVDAIKATTAKLLDDKE